MVNAARAREHAPPDRRLGRYALLEEIGAGGMSVVYRARAFGAEGVVKDVCLKMVGLDRPAADHATLAFINEARLSMRLSHSNIVGVFDFGRAGNDYYLAMEWVDGVDLRKILRTGKLHPIVAAHVAAHLARALAYAHAVHGGIVHRDLKPANVLVSLSGDVKLTDFGIASLSGTRAAGGTPAYMAPEQRRGRTADPRTDLYALGVLLTEMLTAEAPVVEDGWVERRLGPEIPPALAALIRKLTAKEVADRPEGALEVARELERFIGRERAEEISPRDELAHFAAEARRALPLRTSERALGIDTSFIRDGEAADFETRMTQTGTGASVAAAARPERRGGGLAALAAVAFAIGLAAIAIGEVGGRTDPSVAQKRSRDKVAGEVAATREPPSAIVPPPRELAIESTAEPRIAEPIREATERPERTVTAMERVEALAPAEPAAVAPAILNVNAVPWAIVFVDGREIGSSPVFGLELRPGPHVVRVRNEPLGVERERTIELAAGERRNVVIELE